MSINKQMQEYLDYAKSQDKFMNEMKDFFDAHAARNRLEQWKIMEDFQDNHSYYRCGWDGFVIMVYE